MILYRLLVIGVVASGASLLPADDKPKPAAPADDGFKPMFNGKNLDGWVNVNCHPDTFSVRGDEIITTGKPTGFLRTEKQYENFVLEMDWMHVNTKEVGNSGLFVWGDPLPAVGTPYTRGIEVQVLVNLEYKDKKTGAVTATSHGDLFSIWGAKCVPDRPHPTGSQRCLPSEYRAKGGGEWNHYKVTANDGVIKLEVNGKEVSGVSKCNPRKGYLALESEDAECHFKNIKIKELPSTNPKPEECAKVAEGHVSLFNGIDLKGWKTEKGYWKVKDGRLVVDRPTFGVTDNTKLISEKKFGPCELIVDWKMSDYSRGTCVMSVAGADCTAQGGGGKIAVWEQVGEVKSAHVKRGLWNRSVIRFDGTKFSSVVNGVGVLSMNAQKPVEAETIWVEDQFDDVKLGLEVMNVFVRELKEKK
ncbi:3-keto-disaccharide hydrolase [Frigoriglobus tundricola]|uniref:Beta-jelly-roll-type glycoside hydrolase n=1 Tax=Frigoriglobus tundricola TaxID=2774151 RepID=A0A6M5YQA9_9BACT|nr:DUF1080 domain-containing protein [Frigoriglobus tundricola]QJW96098.1 beta-jelly-roll-type glycoside hydrolase [Frigoriglobus tundricola]